MSVRTDIFKPATKPHWVSQRERAATREALVAIARKLVDRNGVQALTLGAVADEAGMARATVYGFFSGRSELLQALQPAPDEPATPAAEAAIVDDGDPSAAIWANYLPDLGVFQPEADTPEEQHETVAAEQPASEIPVEPGPQPAAVEEAEAEEWIVYDSVSVTPVADCVATVEGPPATVEEQIQDDALTHEEEPVPDIETEEAIEHADPVAAEADASVDETPQPATEPVPESQSQADQPNSPAGPLDVLAEQDERRRQQAAHLEEIAKRLILPESAIKDGTDAVIARLDTRIRVLEKSMAGIETRMATSEDEAEQKLKPIAVDIERLQARADGADTREMKIVAELRLSLHQLETRMDALEAPQRGAVSGTLAWTQSGSKPESPPQIQTAPQAVSAVDAAGSEPQVPQTDRPETSSEEDDSAQPDNAKHAYLSAVRGIAKEGARQAAEREAEFEEERRSRRRRVVAAASVAVLSLGVAGALFAFHPGSHGISQARSIPAAAHARASLVHAAMAPLDRLSALAEKGNAPAELLIGLKYLESGHNDLLAARWLARASDRGNPVAQNALGAMYQNGRGVSADFGKAARLYKSAAEQGNRHAMSNLAMLYAGAGQGAKDFSEAARWFERSASFGYVDAQFNLAVLYERGDGVPQSLLDAYKWYGVAAASGDTVAKTRAEAIATQLTSEELAAAQRAVAEFKSHPMNRDANDAPSMAEVLASR